MTDEHARPRRGRSGPTRRRHLIGSLVGAVALVTAALLVPTVASGDVAEHFQYTGDNGPGFWSELNAPDWEDCAGDGQSPVNLGGRATVDPTLEPLELVLEETPMHLLNNGHAIEAEYEEGSTLTIDGTEYELLQFHFHTLAEHTVRSERLPMEMHAVFKDQVSGNLAVVGLFFRIGQASEFLDGLITAGLPQKEGDTSTVGTVDLADVLTPASTASYYRYAGSLTTPPCSEIVTWTVLKRTATMTNAQFRAFQDVMGNNFRPIQYKHGRAITETP